MKNEKGQILLEALLALTIAVIIIGAISFATLNSVNNSSYSRDQNSATQYAQQGLEIVKEKSKSDWSEFNKYGGRYCIGSSNVLPPFGSTSSSCTANINFNGVPYFIRDVVISKNSSNCNNITEILTTVAWSDGKCATAGSQYCNKVTLNSCVANLNSVSAP